MEYVTYGNKNNRSIVLIHGMATTATLCYEHILPYLNDYYVVLVRIDGHIEGETDPFRSLAEACTDVENYINNELNGEVYCLSGFSLGGTMAVEIAGRNHVGIKKLFLDAAFLTRMGPFLSKLYTSIFWCSINWLIHGNELPEFLLDAVMGEGNRAVIDMLYTGVRKETIVNACHDVYSYSIPETIRSFSGDAIFVYGSHEPYPRRSAKLLQSYLPSLRIMQIEGMGHGQYIMASPKEYTDVLKGLLEDYETKTI